MKLGELVDFEDVTDQGNRTIKVWLRDKETKQLLGQRIVKRAFVAKAFLPTSETPIVRSMQIDGKFVIEI